MWTGYKPNEILFNQSNEMDRRKVVEISQKIFSKVISNLKKTKQRMEKNNETKETPQTIQEGEGILQNIADAVGGFQT